MPIAVRSAPGMEWGLYPSDSILAHTARIWSAVAWACMTTSMNSPDLANCWNYKSKREAAGGQCDASPVGGHYKLVLLHCDGGSIQKPGVARFVAQHCKQFAVGWADHETLGGQTCWNTGIARLPGSAVVGRAPDASRVRRIRIVAIKHVAGSIAPQGFAVCRVVVRQNIGPAIPA